MQLIMGIMMNRLNEWITKSHKGSEGNVNRDFTIDLTSRKVITAILFPQPLNGIFQIFRFTYWIPEPLKLVPIASTNAGPWDQWPTLSMADCVPRILWWMLWPTAATRTINQCQWEAMSIWLPKTTENTPSHRLWSAWMKECFFCLCGLTRQQCCWPFPTCKTSSQPLSSQLRCCGPQKSPLGSFKRGENGALF